MAICLSYKTSIINQYHIGNINGADDTAELIVCSYVMSTTTYRNLFISHKSHMACVSLTGDRINGDCTECYLLGVHSVVLGGKTSVCVAKRRGEATTSLFAVLANPCVEG